jgi:hypothetical protein
MWWPLTVRFGGGSGGLPGTNEAIGVEASPAGRMIAPTVTDAWLDPSPTVTDE